jgi:hypothetical protein
VEERKMGHLGGRSRRAAFFLPGNAFFIETEGAAKPFPRKCLQARRSSLAGVPTRPRLKLPLILVLSWIGYPEADSVTLLLSRASPFLLLRTWMEQSASRFPLYFLCNHRSHVHHELSSTSSVIVVPLCPSRDRTPHIPPYGPAQGKGWWVIHDSNGPGCSTGERNPGQGFNKIRGGCHSES